MEPAILLIEDDSELAELVTEYLSGEGFVVTVAEDGEEGIALAQRREHALIVLDLMLPKLSGTDVLKKLRPAITTPVIILTARGDPVDRVLGLELGADDYLAKPFNPRELVARIRAVLRRAQPAATSQQVAQHFGALTLDTAGFRAFLDTRELPLSTLEFELLVELAGATGRVLSREALLERVRHRDFDVFDRSIDVHVSHIRQKLGDDPKSPRWIKTVRGVGYMFLQERTT
jgi:DNA-binding response OmpR family regulator